MLKSHKDLKVWKKSYKLSLLVYKATRKFPKSEIYGLTSQMRRAATAVPSNIAEGYTRQHNKEYIHFLSIAYSSVNELETQLLLSKDLKYLPRKDFEKLHILKEEIAKMLYKLMQSLKSKKK